MNEQFQLNPLAVIAAILMNHGKTDKIKFKPDDSTEEVELQASLVGISNNGEAALCVLPLEKLVECQANSYVVRFQVDSGSLVVFVTKQEKGVNLVAPNGQAFVNENKLQQQFNSLMEKLK